MYQQSYKHGGNINLHNQIEGGNPFLVLCDDLRKHIYSFIEPPEMKTVEEARQFRILPSISVSLFLWDFKRELIMDDYIELVKLCDNPDPLMPTLEISCCEDELLMTSHLVQKDAPFLQKLEIDIFDCSNDQTLIYLWNAIASNSSLRYLQLVIGASARRSWSQEVSTSLRNAMIKNNTLESLVIYHDWENEKSEIKSSPWIESLASGMKLNRTLKNLVLEVLVDDQDSLKSIVQAENKLRHLEVVDMKNRACIDLGNELKRNKSIQSIKLAGNFPTSHFSRLSEMLRTNSIITFVELNSRQPMEAFTDGRLAKQLFRSLKSNNHLRSVILEAFCIDVHAAIEVASFIKDSETIRRIELCSCYWVTDKQETGFKKIAQAINESKLKTLSMKHRFGSRIWTWAFSQETLNAFRRASGQHCNVLFSKNKLGDCTVPAYFKII